jgi:hypothetical protein
LIFSIVFNIIIAWFFYNEIKKSKKNYYQRRAAQALNNQKELEKLCYDLKKNNDLNYNAFLHLACAFKNDKLFSNTALTYAIQSE